MNLTTGPSTPDHLIRSESTFDFLLTVLLATNPSTAF